MIMKSVYYLVTAIALFLLPLGVTAQEHIENAFADFLKQKGVTYSESHAKDSDPVTHQKRGMMDAYTFKAEKWNSSMLDNIRAAIRKDSDRAYQENWETGCSEDYVAKQRNILYNDRDGVRIGFEYPNYIQLCFADGNDSNFRYAYVVEWDEEKGTGRLIKTYAPLPQRQKSGTRYFSFPDLSSDMISIPDVSVVMTNEQTAKHATSSAGWLTKFDIYRKKFQENPKGIAASAFATKIYELCKNCTELNNTERGMVAEQVEKLISLTKDDMIRTLFNSAIENLKEQK